jgi:hypothetical protein
MASPLFCHGLLENTGLAQINCLLEIYLMTALAEANGTVGAWLFQNLRDRPQLNRTLKSRQEGDIPLL